MFLSLMNIGAGRYDGDTPTDPPPTEEVTDPPTEETNPPAEETDTSTDETQTETPQETEQPAENPEPTAEETETPAETSTDENNTNDTVSTEEPTAKETVVEPVATESPESTDEANTEGDVNDTSPATEEPTPAPDKEAAVAPAEESTEEEPQLEPLLSELPESTDVVVLDEAGNSVPLVTSDADEIVKSVDPMWCPAGSAPNDPGCVAYATIPDLITAMATTPTNFDENAVIYFEKPANPGFTDPFNLSETSLGTSSFDTIKNYNLTLQGGWNGGTTTDYTGKSDFNTAAGAYMQVGSSSNPWVGNVTLSKFDFNGGSPTSETSVAVYTTSGDILLDDVNVLAQGGDGSKYAAYLESNSGDITVNNTSFFDGNNSPGNESKGFHAKTNSGKIDISDTVFRDSAGTNNNGANLSAPIVTLNSVTAQRNEGHGIAISNANQVTLNNVTAGPNTAGQGNGLSGVYVDGTGSTIVNIVGGSFNQNGQYGVEVHGSVLNEVSAPTCANNSLGTPANPCYNVNPNSHPTISVNDVTVVGNTVGGWTLSFNMIGSASDAEDGTPSVSCSPAIGSVLPVGATTNVTCTATDNGLLTAIDSGNVTVQAPIETVGNNGSSTTKSTSTTPQTFVIAVTGGLPFEISCNGPVTNILNPPGVQVTFSNLCGNQAELESVDESELPGELPSGVTFINGFSASIRKGDTLLQVLPANAQLQINITVPANVQGADLAVMFWDGSQWVELSGQMTATDFELVSSQGGTFILVSK